VSTLANTLELRAFVLFKILDSFYLNPLFREKMPPQMISAITSYLFINVAALPNTFSLLLLDLQKNMCPSVYIQLLPIFLESFQSVVIDGFTSLAMPCYFSLSRSQVMPAWLRKYEFLFSSPGSQRQKLDLNSTLKDEKNSEADRGGCNALSSTLSSSSLEVEA
jgi:hypothetical protein